jgi:hypothetical protein
MRREAPTPMFCSVPLTVTAEIRRMRRSWGGLPQTEEGTGHEPRAGALIARSLIVKLGVHLENIVSSVPQRNRGWQWTCVILSYVRLDLY